MTRSFFAAFLVGVAGITLAPAVLQGCSQTGVGDPCTPEQEYDNTFNGFDPGEVNTEAKSFQCQTRLCLVNHFQGRVSCPYGQNDSGNPPQPSTGKFYPDSNGNIIPACATPGSVPNSAGVFPDPTDQLIKGETITDSAGTSTNPTVQAQCTSRTADKAVYCSCRCENIDGNTNDGANYCKCPEGFACTQLVTTIGKGDTGLTGGYCMKVGTDYGAGTDCPSVPIGQPVTATVCDASKATCGSWNGQ